MTVDIDELRAAKSYQDLGRAFGLSHSALANALYGRASTYHSFLIAKRSGGHREIHSPFGLRRIVQENLAQILGGIYRANEWAHGFVPGRSVATNAMPHVQCATLINVDLEDFFPSITFQRVRGVFLSRPIGLSWFAANVLAHACTYQGRLPAGGVTSPVLSNFILSKLDKALGALAARYGGTYTRYSDDLTFSFDRPIGQLKGIASKGDSGEWEVGSALVDLISANGFAINSKKTRIRGDGARKEVTGLIVNEKRNVSRSWLRDLEKDVYSAEKFGLPASANRMYPSLDQGVAVRKFLRRLHGKISYLSMVRGRNDWVVAELAFRFNTMSSSPLRVPDVEKITQQNRLTRSVLTVFGYKAQPSDFHKWDEVGSGFVFERGLIVTAAHVLVSDEADLPVVYVTHPHQPDARIPCEVLVRDVNRDVALLRPRVAAHEICRIRFAAGVAPSPGDDVVSVGFPAYKYGGKHHVQKHAVSGVYAVSAVQKFSLTGTIVGGLSGGPVLNGGYEVVGLVHRGAVGGGHANEGITVREILKVVASV
mgnify:CR=1 FL=1